MLEIEREHWRKGFKRIAGVDEAGRGPLAGPVVASAVIIDSALAESNEDKLFSGLTDSKKLSPILRGHFYKILSSNPGVLVGIGFANSNEIDDLNILNATHLAMWRALNSLPMLPDIALIDGSPIDSFPCYSKAIVKGDSKSLLIAAASVVAKEIRDKMMKAFDVEFPGYGFAQHKGYGTSLHMQMLFKQGPTPIHRRSFRPVREAANILKNNDV